MAHPSILKVLQQGAEAWNNWRERRHVSVKNPNLENARIHGIILRKANLTGASLRGADLSEADLTEADLRGANLTGANLEKTNLTKANLRNANLTNVYMKRTLLTSANLDQANLKKAWIEHAHLISTDLTYANLKYAHIRKSLLKDTDIKGAEAGYTIFDDIDMSEILGVEEIQHENQSLVSLKTIYRSKGKIPIAFLRGCGLSDVDIEYAKLANPSLDSEQVDDITNKIRQLYLGGGNEYYSCFMSYSSKDQEFAQCLHDDLQNNGVRCWFDREDLKIGDQIRLRIDQEIRLRDKLLVILSENSVKSEWVGDEVEAALEEEIKSNRLVLFPIRLDDTVLNSRDDWAAKIKRRRHIGDFSNWKDKASYQKAFERLLRDLKATGGQVNGE